MSQCYGQYGMGWMPAYPDLRDYTVDLDSLDAKYRLFGQKHTVKHMLTQVGVAGALKAPASSAVDLRQWCSPIENQGPIGSCTAHAGVGLLEYYELRAMGKHVDASRLFLYKATRNLMKMTGDTGAFLRTTMGAMVLFGVPPEEYWPYDVAAFDKEPTPFCYAFAQNYQAIQYVRLDVHRTAKDTVLGRVKAFVAAGLPAVFGFSVYSSFEQAEQDGCIPYPGEGEKIVGGHAVMAVGYDNALEIANKSGDDKQKTKGALLIRNSWGKGWGDAGYGWLPYDYVEQGLAVDWWTLLKNEWVDSGQFKAG